MGDEEKPKRWTRTPAPTAETKPPEPEALKPFVARAKARVQARAPGPVLELARSPDGSTWEWPFEGEPENWQWLVMDALGTRNIRVAVFFLGQLMDLCAAKEQDAELHQWVPETADLEAILHIVGSHKPKNEAQAALAAQAAAVHMMTMKLGGMALNSPHDSRTVASFGKMARTSVMLNDALGRQKGKRRTTQTIKVEKRVYVDNRQVHLHPGGEGKENGQAQAPDELRARARRAGSVEVLPAVPGADEAENLVQFPMREGEEALPDARRIKRLGRAGG